MKKATDFNQILDSLLAKRDLGSEESKFALGQIMQGKANPSQIAAFLTALKVKGETAQEIIGLAMAMRESSIKINASSMHLVDTCGTGGDSSRTFNISTCAALVAAGAGACVAKHGNRAATSQSGSADVLEALGVKILTDPLEAKTQLETIGIAFLYAPAYHPAMKTVAPIRKELGFKTVFNI
ncbi:anthranilate phosphoribosyltransferase, partial [Candidatus Parvarchaeota archaeon]|nr:anthranilate phosphoribosyltransferase [Candidatus Parvarchaeota archaeon]